jgi:hypothetical protein
MKHRGQIWKQLAIFCVGVLAIALSTMQAARAEFPPEGATPVRGNPALVEKINIFGGVYKIIDRWYFDCVRRKWVLASRQWQKKADFSDTYTTVPQPEGGTDGSEMGPVRGGPPPGSKRSPTDPNHAFNPTTGQNFVLDKGNWSNTKTGEVMKSPNLCPCPEETRTPQKPTDTGIKQETGTGPSPLDNPVNKQTDQPPESTPPGSTPSHRQTSCKSCQKAADRLNAASDRLAQDLADPNASPDTIADDRSMVKDYVQMLDDCEKHCKDTSGGDSIFDHVTIGVGVGVGGGNGDNQNHGHNSHGSDNPPTNAQPPQY